MESNKVVNSNKVASNKVVDDGKDELVVNKLAHIRKRNGAVVSYDPSKIANAILKAANAAAKEFDEPDASVDEELSINIAKHVESSLLQEFGEKTPSVEQIQDTVEHVLIEEGHAKTAKAYILYRAKRHDIRSKESSPSDLDTDEQVKLMFEHKSKLLNVVPKEKIESYKKIYKELVVLQKSGELPVHPTNNYLSGNELATNIYERKYFLKNMAGDPIESRPEQVFTRLAAYMGAIEEDESKQLEWAKSFYKELFEGHFLRGGRVIAGAGDLYRLKTLANCFVTVIDKDNLESIYSAAYDCARTYSYGGGIGTDISVLRPRDSIVHNAADKSTGSVSFMELYSLTTGLIGQSGRRGALMLTVDVKHPDVIDFIRVKKDSNWITKQIVEQCKWSGKFDEYQLKETEKQVRENTQVRFANISLKVSDEFMQAVEEQTEHGPTKYLAYEVVDDKPDFEFKNYSYGMPAKNISNYKLSKVFDSFDEVKAFVDEMGHANGGIDKEDFVREERRNRFGDFIVELGSNPENRTKYAIRQSGDFMLYFNSEQTGELKQLVKARTIWDEFVAGNYKAAEPGLIFWSTMTKYSPSNYVGRPIASTNPCGEVPLEDGGACNLASINLSRMVVDGYTDNAKINWDLIKSSTKNLTRFLDNVITWNGMLNPLEKQRNAANTTRRVGLGIMGVADMFNQLGMEYDSDEGIKLLEKIGKIMANATYAASAELSGEKGPSPLFDYEKYSKCPFFQERISDDVKALVKEKGLRNIALLSIAPTGSISNIVLGYKDGKKNYVGVSGGIEPIFSLFYTRRSESFGNKLFKVFHSTIQAYIDIKGLDEKIQKADGLDAMRHILPKHFFRTAHFIEPEMRVKIQGVAQKYIDHSISSTVNLPESVEPEVISNVYLHAWQNGLKGITIYRDGSRYPILSVAQKQTEFQAFKEKMFNVTINAVDLLGKQINEDLTLSGDDVFTLPSGKLTTPFHALDLNLVESEPGVTIKEVKNAPLVSQPEAVTEPEKKIEEKKVDDRPEVPEYDVNNGEKEDEEPEGGVCKIKIVNGQVVKSCSE